MATREFLLPDLGEGLEDAEVARWLVAEGDDVELNQPLVEVDTAKALVEIPSPFKGRISKLHAAAGETVLVGTALVTFELEGDGEPESSKRTAVLVGYGVENSKVSRRRRLGAARQATEHAPAEEASRPSASPPVRKLAAEMGVDLASINGSGPGGRVTREDVLAAAGDSAGAGLESAPSDRDSQSADVDRIPVKGARKLIAQKMSLSASEIPHVTTFLTVDASALMKMRDSLQGDAKVSPLAIVATAFSVVCKAYPKLNASFDADSSEIVLHKKIHLGIATDTERGLLVPVVFNAGEMGAMQMSREISRLADGARKSSLKPDELRGSTVTISNVGSFGAEFGTPIINHPESAILALGVVEPRALVRNGQVVAAPAVTLSLSFDHRVMDGAEAGRALNDLKTLLEDPERLSELS